MSDGIQFKASDDQLKQIAVNAINASSPVGMGYIHYKPKTYTADDVDLGNRSEIYIDYFEGRMVKLMIRKIGPDLYRMRKAVRPDYEGWFLVYPTVESLLKSAGVEEFEENE